MLTRTEWEHAINLLGIPSTFVQAKGPSAQVPVDKMGIRTMTSDDPLVNAYGVGTKVLTLKRSALGVHVPEKFDAVITPDGERLVFDHVTPVHEPGSGVLMGWRAYVRGRGAA